jgi:hypothetical protein
MAIENKEKKTTPPKQRAEETKENIKNLGIAAVGASAWALGAAPFALMAALFGFGVFPTKNEPYKPFLLDKIGDAISGMTKPGKYL